jgi:hypothetical protein
LLRLTALTGRWLSTIVAVDHGARIALGHAHGLACVAERVCCVLNWLANCSCGWRLAAMTIWRNAS